MMHIKSDQRRELLIVDEPFVHVTDVIGDKISLDVEYSLSQLKVMREGATAVRLSILTKHVVPQLNVVRDAKQLIDDARSISIKAKTAARQQETYVIARVMSDFTSKINNELVAALGRGPVTRTTMRTSLKTTSVNALQLTNEELPTLQYSIVSEITGSVDANADIIDMLLRDGTDPSEVTDMTHRSVTPYDTFSGLSRRSRVPEVTTSAASRYLSYLVGNIVGKSTSRDVGATSHVSVADASDQDTINASVNVSIPTSALNVDGKSVSNVFVKFELIRAADGTTIDAVTKSVDLAAHVRFFSIPRTPPRVKSAASEISSHTNIEIWQRDHAATGVRVYVKRITNSSPDIEDYSFLGEYKLRHTDQSLLLTVPTPTDSVAVYRVIPFGANRVHGFEFTNVVIMPKRYVPLKFISLVTQISDVGFELEARGIPKGVAAIQLFRTNKTLHETVPTIIGNTIFITPDVAARSRVTFIDSDVSSGYVYEYVCKLIYKTGVSIIVGHAVSEFTKLNDSRVDTKLSKLNVSHTNEPNVTFDIKTDVLDTDIDAIKRMLVQQNIDSFFSDDILKERDKLKQLIAHSVTRVNLTSGQREDFGVITSGSFSDVDLRKNTSVSPLKYGHKYRYDVIALLRAPETMFVDFVKTVTDQTTKKTYSFKPSKYLHPVTLTRGNIVSIDSLRMLYPKTMMAHGQIGVQSSVDVSFDRPEPAVVNPTVVHFSRAFNVIEWRATDQVRVDHFLVIKVINGMRTIVGKAHSEFEHENCTFIHKLSSRDVGAISYLIVPIFNNYTVGDIAQTNTVIT